MSLAENMIMKKFEESRKLQLNLMTQPNTKEQDEAAEEEGLAEEV
jgi:hypothetical protein